MSGIGIHGGSARERAKASPRGEALCEAILDEAACSPAKGLFIIDSDPEGSVLQALCERRCDLVSARVRFAAIMAAARERQARESMEAIAAAYGLEPAMLFRMAPAAGKQPPPIAYLEATGLWRLTATQPVLSRFSANDNANAAPREGVVRRACMEAWHNASPFGQPTR